MTYFTKLLTMRSLVLLAALTIASTSLASIGGTVVSDSHFNPAPGWGTISYDPLNWSIGINGASNRVDASTTGWLYNTGPFYNGIPVYVELQLDGSVYASQQMWMSAAASKPVIPNLSFSATIPESAITRSSSNPHVVTFKLYGAGSNTPVHTTVMHVWKN